MEEKDSKGFQVKSCLVFGSIYAILFLVLPSSLIMVLSTTGIIQFNLIFFITILIIGSIPVIIAFVKNAFPTDSKVHNIIGIAVATLVGLFLFFIFSGGESFGIYSVKLPDFEASISLQIFAWLMLVAAIVNAAYYSLRFVEVYKGDFFIKFQRGIETHAIKIRHFFRAGYLLIYFTSFLYIFLYLSSLLVSVANLSIQINQANDFNWDDNGTVIPLTDDRLDIITHFAVSNFGVYPVQNVRINIEIFTINTSDITQLFLPNNTKVGESSEIYPSFGGFDVAPDETFTIEIYSQYVVGMLTCDAELNYDISLQLFYAGIFVDLNMSMNVSWTKLT